MFMTRLPRVVLACIALALGGAFVSACGDDEKDSPADQLPAPAATETTESSGDDGAASADPVVVTMKANRNMPEEVDVKVGQKVEWKNEDGYAHNVTSTAGEKIESGNFTDSFDYTPKQAGTIDYVCTIHAGQNGKLNVR
jgi:plastocyanin